MSQNRLERIKYASIAEFGSPATRERYECIADQGLWDSEAQLISRYFTPTASILDIGCGSGRTAIPLTKMGYQVTGVDITPEMIETARRKAQEHGLSIAYEVGDATNLRFDDTTFDCAIFANNGWSQIPGKVNRQKALCELYRVLKPGGVLIHTSHRRYYSPETTLFWLIQLVKLRLLRPLGLKTEEVEYGDIFFRRQYRGRQIELQQFIHMAAHGEVERQITQAGFELQLSKPMGEISRLDGDAMKGSLSARFKSFKSPVFNVCKK